MHRGGGGRRVVERGEMRNTIFHGLPGCRTEGVDITVEMIPYLTVKLLRTSRQERSLGQGLGRRVSLLTALDMRAASSQPVCL